MTPPAAPGKGNKTTCLCGEQVDPRRSYKPQTGIAHLPEIGCFPAAKPEAFERLFLASAQLAPTFLSGQEGVSDDLKQVSEKWKQIYPEPRILCSVKMRNFAIFFTPR